MPKPSSHEVTNMLLAWRRGKQEALNKLIPIVYAELRRRAHYYMKQERKDHSLQTTALINEVYLRLMDCRQINWQDRAHFFAVIAQLMRRILVDYARSCRYQKHGGGSKHLSLDEHKIASNGRDPDLIMLDDALQALATIDARKSQVMELRFFGGLSVKETAEVVGVSPNTVVRDLSFAKAWLAREMNKSVSVNA